MKQQSRYPRRPGASFFGRFKSQFESDLGGRYLSAVMTELLNECPKETLKALNLGQLDFRGIYATTEAEHTVDNRERRSDVEIRDSNGLVKAIIEIKWDDQFSKSNVNQLRDYVKYSKKEIIPFIYLTKYSITQKQQDVLKACDRAKWLRIGDFASDLNTCRTKHQTIRMFLDFMKEEGCMFNEDIDPKALEYLIFKSLSFPHAHGSGHLASKARVEREVPDTLRKLLENARIIAERLKQELFLPCGIGGRATVGFSSSPWVSKKKFGKLAKKEKDDQVDVGGNVGCGDYYVWSAIYIDKICLEFGYCFDAEVKKSVEYYVYAKFGNGEFRDCRLGKLKSEGDYHRACISAIKAAIDNKALTKMKISRKVAKLRRRIQTVQSKRRTSSAR